MCDVARCTRFVPVEGVLFIPTNTGDVDRGMMKMRFNLCAEHFADWAAAFELRYGVPFDLDHVPACLDFWYFWLASAEDIVLGVTSPEAH